MATLVKDIQLHSMYLQLFQLSNSIHQISQALHGLSTVWIIWAYGRISIDDLKYVPSPVSASKSLDTDEVNYDPDTDLRHDMPTIHVISTTFKSQESEDTMLKLTQHREMHYQTTSQNADIITYTPKNCRAPKTPNKKYAQNHYTKHKRRSYTQRTCKKPVDPTRTAIAALSEEVDNKKYIFQCGECKEQFSKGRFLKTHIRKQNHVTASGCFQCGNCGLVFMSLPSLSHHVTNHSPVCTGSEVDSASYCCKQCLQPFLSNRKLLQHIRRTHNKKVNSKSIEFSATFTDNVLFIEHPKTHSEKPFPCSFCGMCFARKSHVAIHERVHTSENRYKCNVCDKAYSHRRLLLVHERSHYGYKPFACAMCPNKAYASQNGLTLHMNAHHSDSPTSYQCHVCGKMFSCKIYLRKHEEKHSGNVPFSCSECSKSFASKGHLNDHMRMHSNERPYQCSHCGMTFKQNSNMRSHERTHSENKAFHCVVCSKSFGTKVLLATHMERHSEKRQYSCELCDKTFYNKKDVDKHRIVHTGQKPHRCDHCGRSFAQNWNLKVHVKTVHEGEKLNQCQCGKSFVRSKALTDHKVACDSAKIPVADALY